MIIDLGEWTPDRPEIGRGRLRTAKGVRPAADGYEPIGALVTQSTALATRPLGAVSMRGLDGLARTYAGTAAGLYELSTGGAWEDRSKTGGYATADGSRWRWAQFADRALATNFDDPVQYADMAAAGDFANLPNAPRARYIAAFRDFVVLGDTEDSALRVQWSALNDSTGWTAGANQSDYQDFPDGGLVTGVLGSEQLYVFQEQAIRRASYLGPPLVLAFDVVERGRGLPKVNADSLVQAGGRAFFLSEDGFSMFDGAQSALIGRDRVDQWFRATVGVSYLDRLSASIDPLNKLVSWAFASAESMGLLDRLLIYNWATDRWSYAEYQLSGVAPLLTRGVTLEELDALFPGGIDAHNLTVDDNSLAGGASRLGGFSSDYKLGYFSGAPVEATLETDDILAGPQILSFVRGCRPLIDGEAYVTVGVRDRAMDAVAWGDESGVDATGNAPLRALGRYVRLRLRTPAEATWTKAQGLEIDLSAGGRR